MELGPLLPGRIPNTLVAQRLTENLQLAQSTLTKLQESIATGHKFVLPSDSPSDALTTISLQQVLDQKTQVSTNIDVDTSFLHATDSAISTIGDALNKAKQLALSGVGDTSTPAEKDAMALETQSLVQQIVNAGNSTFRGRYLFGGSLTNGPPFTLQNDGSVRYEGDQQKIQSFIDVGLLQANNVDGASAFGALTPPAGGSLNPAVTLQTKIADLAGGQGIALGSITVTASSAVPASRTVDLSSAHSLQDIKQLVEAAFPPGTLTVGINATQSGLRITAAAGTVAVSDPVGSKTAADLGIASSAVPQISGTALTPRLSLTTPLSALNGGAGIGPTAGFGLKITNGPTTKVVDLSSATTVEDVVNLLRDPSLNLSVGFNATGDGLAVSSRLSGASLSIGENGGTNATQLGLRTFTATTQLVDLNYGRGVPVNAGTPLVVTRRDGTTSSIDLSGALTVQDVLTKINAVSPGHLVASLNTVGNGISLRDDSGAGPLTVASNAVSQPLGIAGSEPGNNPATPLVGADPNPLEAHGALNALIRLQKALRTHDDVELTRVAGLIDQESPRLSDVRSELGGRMKTLTDVQNRLKQEQIQIQTSMSQAYDTDFSQAITQLVSLQTTFQAALKSASQTLQLTLYNYI